ncbi:MAG: class I SAM-dependent methyltransferase [Chloroflexota bacterium]
MKILRTSRNKFLRQLAFNLRYLFRPPWDTGVSPPELLDFIRTHEPGKVFDMGCGTGTNLITLAQHGWQASGVDFAPRAIRLAKHKAQKAGVQVDLQVGDVTKLYEPSNTYDLILDIGCFHGLSRGDRAPYIQIVERMLKPGGTLLLYVIFRKDNDAPPPGITEGDLDMISTYLKQKKRTDSLDKIQRPSAWLAFQKHSTSSHLEKPSHYSACQP